MKYQRTPHIPKGCHKVTDKRSTAVAYWRATGKEHTPFEAVAFHGRTKEPDWHFLFQSLGQLERRIGEHFESVRTYAKAAAKWRQVFVRVGRPRDAPAQSGPHAIRRRAT